MMLPRLASAAATPKTRLAVGNDAVVCTENGGTVPPDALGAMPFDVPCNHAAVSSQNELNHTLATIAQFV